MFGNYILDENNQPVRCHDLMEWAKWFEIGTRRVKLDQVGPIRVSTVFLGIDHGWGDGPPILWETMIFCDEEVEAPDGIDQMQWRYTSHEEAVRTHDLIVKSLKELKDGERIKELPLRTDGEGESL